jgi:DNA-binding response OmpR family regulator
VPDEKNAAESFSLGGTETLLFVEDESLLAETVQLFLESKGYIVYMAQNGQDALQLYKEHHKEISLVLSDVGLPGIPAMDMLTKLQEINPKVASGFFDSDLRIEFASSGVKGFIQKPYMPDEILYILRKILDEERQSVIR